MHYKLRAPDSEEIYRMIVYDQKLPEHFAQIGETRITEKNNGISLRKLEDQENDVKLMLKYDLSNQISILAEDNRDDDSELLKSVLRLKSLTNIVRAI